MVAGEMNFAPTRMIGTFEDEAFEGWKLFEDVGG
jgi:hypothetical protein